MNRFTSTPWMRRLGAAWMATAALICVGPGTAQATSWGESCPRNWMSEGMIGVSTHYIPGNPDDIDKFAKAFDVVRVAEQAKTMHASWFVFTVQHQNWLLLSPNAAFTRIVGTNKYQSTRDVPAELIPELQKRGIKLMLYVNIRVDPDSHAPADVVQKLGRAWPPTDAVIEDMAAVYREYSLRYGRNVAGWWVDSAGVPAYAQAPEAVRERWFRTIANALRAGNPEAQVAFNPGVRVQHYTQAENFTAGESNAFPAPPQARCMDGAQWHMWTYVGGWWGADGKRFSDAELCQSVAKVASGHGAITFDLGTTGYVRAGLQGERKMERQGGFIDPVQVQQVRDLLDKRQKGPGGDQFVCGR